MAFHQVIQDNCVYYKDFYYSKSPLLENVTNSLPFAFNDGVIEEFWQQLGVFIDKLGVIYEGKSVRKSTPSVKWNDKRHTPTEQNSNNTINLLSDTFEFDIGNEQDSVDEVIASICLESSKGLDKELEIPPAKSASEGLHMTKSASKELETVPPAKSANDVEIKDKKPSPTICKGHMDPPPKSDVKIEDKKRSPTIQQYAREMWVHL